MVCEIKRGVLLQYRKGDSKSNGSISFLGTCSVFHRFDYDGKCGEMR